MLAKNQVYTELSEQELDVVAGGVDLLPSVSQFPGDDILSDFTKMKHPILQVGTNQWMENEKNNKFTIPQ
ncbi:hypothetical protein [Calothrix sp. NIES-2098]|uniref:hypothetical protein n=1 Tax=Calothrix sp. NIES-2098 TaxID=1954171 RepID=UPI000B61234B|nr:hypothetical protein NIES2098_23130 [Calothrix sp. NIES-2098]